MTQDKSLCFVDVETTGTNAVNGRIIEIGVIRVDDGVVVDQFQSLLNPETHVDPFIENMTGITKLSLESAPLFSDIKYRLLDMFEDAVFVAHNVRFDYSFVRNEFKRYGINFRTPHFCTVRLARQLYPRLGRYNLDNIIANFNIPMENRHRAFDDAKAIWEFYKLSKTTIDPQTFTTAIDFLLKKPSLPPGMKLEDLDILPEGCGVYIMYGENDLPIYIGKSIDIKDRVLSHFSNDYLSGTDMKISQQIKRVEAIETAGELSALLLESALIKKHQPLLNRMLRNSMQMSVLIKEVNPKGYNTVAIKIADDINISDIENIIGVFRSPKQAKDYLSRISKENLLCLRLMGLDKGKGACFYTQLNQCNGACDNREMNLKYNLRFDKAFSNKKVKPWVFNSPILIKESGDKDETHLIDKWCYLGSIKNESENLSELIRDYKFDYDTYKILKRFILNPHNQKYVTSISSDYLKTYL